MNEFINVKSQLQIECLYNDMLNIRLKIGEKILYFPQKYFNDAGLTFLTLIL